MAGFVPRGRAESALRFLPQKLARFETFHAANHMLLIREMLDELERDDVLMHVTAALRRRAAVTGKAWADESVKAGSPRPLPDDPVACIGLRIDVLKQIRLEKIDVRYFAANLYPGEHLNERLMHWKRTIVHPLAEDLRRLALVLLEKLPDTDRFDMEALASDVLDGFGARAFGSRSWTDADDDAAIAASTKAGDEAAPRDPRGDLEAALASLDKAIAAAGDLSADEKHDLALEARILALDAKKGRKEKARSKLDALAKRPSLEKAALEVKKLL
jgi:hypothetical protein